MDEQQKKPVYKKWWFWVLTVVVLAVIGSQTSKHQEANTSADASATTAAAPAAPSAEDKAKAIEDQKAHTVTASALFDRYEANEVAADNAYKDKSFWVTGTVESVGKDLLKRPYVALKTGNIILTVQCFVEDGNAISQLSKGDKVTLHGTGGGKLGNVFVNECTIVPNL